MQRTRTRVVSVCGDCRRYFRPACCWTIADTKVEVARLVCRRNRRFLDTDFAAYSAQFEPPILKKWKERRTFFECLYERDRIRAPKTNDEENKDSWVRVRLSQSSLYAKILLRPR